MTVDDFNQWRANYNRMSYADQVKFYNRVEVDHPLQVAFDIGAFIKFFDYICNHWQATVIELGGWKGELAKEILSLYPEISLWLNYEISQRAVGQAVCHDTRYRPNVPYDFMWQITLPAANVFVSSHAIEHIRQYELESLFLNLPPTLHYIALQAPLADGPTDWTDYYGSHILECGWLKIIEMLKKYDFELFMEQNEFRGFKRNHYNTRLESRRLNNAIPTTELAAIPA